MLKITDKDTKILNFLCFVLCLNSVIPKDAPTPPIKKAKEIRVFSLIRLNPRIAKNLSAPYIIITAKFHKKSKYIIFSIIYLSSISWEDTTTSTASSTEISLLPPFIRCIRYSILPSGPLIGEKSSPITEKPTSVAYP